MSAKYKLLAALLVAGLTACAAPQYDEQADTQITALQKEVDSHIVKLISDGEDPTTLSVTDAAYPASLAWYNQVDSDMETLELRMEASPDPSTANLPMIFANLRQQFTNIQAAHRSKGTLPAVDWHALRMQLNQQFSVLMTYELSLKSGGGTTSGATKSQPAVKTK